jgi:hypothetical protein
MGWLGKPRSVLERAAIRLFAPAWASGAHPTRRL